MELKRVKELMEIEKECVTRSDTCNRDCARCELVQDDIELKEAYSSIIQLIEHEIQLHGTLGIEGDEKEINNDD